MRLRWWWIPLMLMGALTAGVGYRQFFLLPAMRVPVLREMGRLNSAHFRDETYIGPWTVEGALLCGQVASKDPKDAPGGAIHFYEFVSYGWSGEAIVLDDPPEDGESYTCHRLAGGASIPWWWLRW